MPIKTQFLGRNGGKCMLTFKEFCEKALSNDVVCIVDDILHGKPKYCSFAAYQFLLEKGNPARPSYADDVLDKEVERFTIGKCDPVYGRSHFIVKIK